MRNYCHILIINLLLNLRHISQMENTVNNTSYSDQLAQVTESPQLRSLQEEDQLIEMYLNQEVFYHRSLKRIAQINDLSLQKNQQRNQNTLPLAEESSPKVEQLPKHKKSIFHNFQKHLITIIKKYMHISKNRVNECQDGDVAYDLWQAFIKTNSFNKRLLHIAFGVEGSKYSKDSVDKFANQFEQFKKVSAKYEHESIIRAQQIIRQHVSEQASQLGKFFLKSNSSITKFDQFYGYYSNFIKEIGLGPISKRLSKSSKQSLISNLKSKRCG